MKKKRMIQAVLSVLLIAVIAVGGTLAYLVASDNPVVNTFTFAKVDTDIDEPSGGNGAAKKPKIQNKGNTEVFVRAKVVVTTLEGSSQLVTEDDLEINYNKEGYAPPAESGWVNTDAYWYKSAASDGWYYYSEKLEAEQFTEPLFDGLTVKDEVDPNAKFDVIVYQESIIAGNYSSAYEAFNPPAGE